ncbi:beta-glucosidase, partial [Corallococcus coralloides]|nr:beta-glucosidase [Corallococcus coralloides]
AQARAAASHGVQVVWSLMHYGWPDRLDPLARPGQFIDAFSWHCTRVAELIADVEGPPPVYQPINEISFLAWAATSTELIHCCRPPAPERGPELKRVLVGAALRGIDALWSVAPGARIVHTDPAIHVG